MRIVNLFSLTTLLCLILVGCDNTNINSDINADINTNPYDHDNAPSENQMS
ncbi:hypothetical protein Xmau_01284 [Xenorhabdus mauleonii]|uniref:Lipoprotein n=1 Tax=Xenorhabdus mauleonii TaxID=351675 RepID=A0A1I3KKW6_9GAMM|nr:hypothetical protein Xmau_01284 [Xenorhabdus mauleonii]SFI72968.1 hypothetical protein SAMN05421680_103113 [Xenorhabdus mauleonii]